MRPRPEGRRHWRRRDRGWVMGGVEAGSQCLFVACVDEMQHLDAGRELVDWCWDGLGCAARTRQAAVATPAGLRSASVR